MKLIRRLWLDEAGYVLSAEAVLLGTVGVVGATVSLGAISKSVNDELQDVAHAFRRLDQSYCIESQTGCRAWTAGSCFTQQDVEISQAELEEWIDDQTRSDRVEPEPLTPTEAEESEFETRRREYERQRRAYESDLRNADKRVDPVRQGEVEQQSPATPGGA